MAKNELYVHILSSPCKSSVHKLSMFSFRREVHATNELQIIQDSGTGTSTQGAKIQNKLWKRNGDWSHSIKSIMLTLDFALCGATSSPWTPCRTWTHLTANVRPLRNLEFLPRAFIMSYEFFGPWVFFSKCGKKPVLFTLSLLRIPCIKGM